MPHEILLDMSSNENNIMHSLVSAPRPSKVTVAYHPRNDLRNRKEVRCTLQKGGNVSVASLMNVVSLPRTYRRGTGNERSQTLPKHSQ